MIASSPAVEPLVAHLQQLLDEEIGLLQAKQSQMESLSGAILGRDDTAMEATMAQMETTARQQSAVESRLSALRVTIAGELGLGGGPLRLSTLISHLPPQQASLLEYRRNQIVALAEQIRRRHVEVAILLRECARINRMLLESLTGGQSVTTYGADGKDVWHGRGGVLDMRR